MFRYRLLLIIASPLILGHVLWKAISNRDGRYLRQRLGFGYGAGHRPANHQLPRNCLWFHCASVGEVNTALPLLKNLHARQPQRQFIITTNTVTGGKIVRQQQLAYLHHSYLPFDWRFSTARFIHRIRPAALYVLETEIWPNLFSACAKRGIAIHIINARLSAKTMAARPWVKSLLKTALSNVTAIAARSEADASGYARLGADNSRITTTGNLKFTTALRAPVAKDNISTNNGFAIDRGFVLVASTHEDEERQIYHHWRQLGRQELLVIAPRHPERAASVIRALDGDSVAVRSKNQPITPATRVFLLDTVGELKNYFSNAKLVIMGGSFVAVGGHNILEPASFNCAIITGPHMENFRQELALMQAQNAILQVASCAELATQMRKLLEDDAYRQALQQNTARLTHNVEEILQRYSDLILG
jgi:3-deoxy-D-manno-octulosonic-acid transferase